jgi:hypothetical protein
MTEFDWIVVVMTFFSVLFIPLLVLIVRGAMKWTRVEASLERLVGDVNKLVIDKDKVHNEMLTTMREDRNATDQRLRWLEVNVWQTTRKGVH